MTSGLGEVQRMTERYGFGSTFSLLALDRGSANKVGGGEGGSRSLPWENGNISSQKIIPALS
jgi:hypothetical protein